MQQTTWLRRIFKAFSATLFVLAAGGAASLPAAEKTKPAVVIDDIVVTAARIQEPMARVPARVEVITREEIEPRGPMAESPGEFEV